MRKPNFFIIGAPKCGTTSLALYLLDHSRIFFAARKELHFFNKDMASRLVHSEPDYYAHFRDAGPEHIAVGEGSVLYLYSDSAVPEILKAIPDAKFVVLVRNPVDMAASMYAHLRRSGDEDSKDFATAWRMQDKRRKGGGIPRFCSDPSLLLYGNICSIGWQLRRLYKRAARDRVLVLLQDDLKRDARAVYLQTLEFLGVPDDGRTLFPVYNARQKPVRSQAFQVMIRSLSRLKERSGIEGTFGILPWIQRFNVQKARKAENETLEPQLRSELVDYFRNDVQELAHFVNRDLSKWLAS